MVTLIAPRKVVATATASATLARGAHTPVDATSGPLTMTLPANAPAGVEVSVEKVDASTNAVTISGSLRGVASSIPLTSQYEARTFLSDGAGSWRPTSDHRTTASLSATIAGQTGPVATSSARSVLSGAIRSQIQKLLAAGAEMATNAPTITVDAANGSGLNPAGNFDKTAVQWDTGSAGSGVVATGKKFTLALGTGHLNFTGSKAAEFEMLGGGNAAYVAHGPASSVDSAVGGVLFPTFRTTYATSGGSGGTSKIAFRVVPYGGGAYGGMARFKIGGKYIDLEPITFEGTSSYWVILDGIKPGRHLIELDMFQCALQGVQSLQTGDSFTAPTYTGPSIFMCTDSYFGTGAYPYRGISHIIAEALGWKDVLMSNAGGTGFAKDNGANTNFVARTTAQIPNAGHVDAVVYIGSVNDKTTNTGQTVQQAATAAYAAVAPVPVIQVVWNASSDNTMDAVLAAYQAAAAAATQQVTIIDLTKELTGSGNAPLNAPLLFNTLQYANKTVTAAGPAAGTYEYVVTALYSDGSETTASNAKRYTLDGTTQPVLNWRTEPYATGYNVYRSTVSGTTYSNVVKIATNTTALKLTDTGIAGTAGSPPATNGTGSAGAGNSPLLRGRDGTHRSPLGNVKAGENAAVEIAARLGALPVVP